MKHVFPLTLAAALFLTLLPGCASDTPVPVALGTAYKITWTSGQRIGTGAVVTDWT